MIHPIVFGKAFMPEFFVVESPPFHWELGRHILSDNKKCVLAAPRGHAKTTFLTILIIMMVCLRQIEYCLIVSDTTDQAQLILDTIKGISESNHKITALFPGFIRGKKWKETDIIFANGVRIQAVGAGKKIRGRKHGAKRPDFVLVDDLENDEAVASLERRLKLRKWFRSALLPALDPLRGKIRFVGTILHSDSLLSRLLRTKGWLRKIWRCMNPDGSKALWEELHPLEKLLTDKEEAREDGLLSSWYSEWMNYPFAAEESPFSAEDIKYFSENPDKKGYVSIYVDPAIGQKQKHDFTAYTVVKATHDGYWYVLSGFRRKDDPSTIIKTMAKLLKKYKADVIGVESVQFQKSLCHFAENEEIAGVSDLASFIEPITPDEDKRRRILGLQPYFKRGRILIKDTVSHRLEAELLNIDSSDHDDLADSLAGHLFITMRPEPPKKRRKIFEDSKSERARKHRREIKRHARLKKRNMREW